MVTAHRSTSTKILLAIPLPIANREPLTFTSKGPLNGADFTTVIFVPGVKPKSDSRWMKQAVIERFPQRRLLDLCLHFGILSKLMSVEVMTPVSPLLNEVKGSSISFAQLHLF
jgi:hypothetical protein